MDEKKEEEEQDSDVDDDDFIITDIANFITRCPCTVFKLFLR